MARKIPVAWVCTAQIAGTRTYKAFDKTGAHRLTVETQDHGHGAHLAQRELERKGFTPTSAEWTRPIFRQHRN